VLLRLESVLSSVTLSDCRDGPRKSPPGVRTRVCLHVGCWTHARRKFVDAVKVNPQDGEAVKMVTRMDALFLVDRHARQQQMSEEARLELRRQHAESWAEEIRSECQALSRVVLPKSALGQAAAYTLNMWMKLRRCFDYAEVELSNRASFACSNDVGGFEPMPDESV